MTTPKTKFCKDCKNYNAPASACARIIAPAAVDLVTGKEMPPSSYRFDAHYERQNEERVVGGQTIVLCGASGRFWEAP